jgi:peptidoglycan-associated lipoprotein
VRTRSLLGVGPLAVAVILLDGCHKKTVPEVTASLPAPNADSLRLARARADSIARADADRRAAAALEQARADSIRRAAEAAGSAAAARAALVEPVYFDFDRSEIRLADRPALERKVAIINANPRIELRIDGHSDERGSDEYNFALSMRRAAVVKQYLVEHGVDSGRLVISSGGEERPVCPDHDESCWSRNRRDEFVLTAGADRIASGR